MFNTTYFISNSKNIYIWIYLRSLPECDRELQPLNDCTKTSSILRRVSPDPTAAKPANTAVHRIADKWRYSAVTSHPTPLACTCWASLALWRVTSSSRGPSTRSTPCPKSPPRCTRRLWRMQTLQSLVDKFLLPVTTKNKSFLYIDYSNAFDRRIWY